VRQLHEVLRIGEPQHVAQLATWNIVNLGARDRYDESMFYIAEILSRFDVIAIQEVKDDLSGLETLRGLLGPWWRFVVSDVSLGDPGNTERLAYLFDSRKLRFGGMAGELVLVADDGTPVAQFDRTPYVVGFASSWFRFMMATVHIAWGRQEANFPARVAEIANLADVMAARADADGAWSQNLIVLGDFNLFHENAEGLQALQAAGFTLPHGRADLRPTNVGRDARYYDQILYRFPDATHLDPVRVGVVDPFDAVYSNDKLGQYENELRIASGAPPADPESYYRTHWRRREMSDHLLLWSELRIDFGHQYLVDNAQ
jgi:endonuclease/exonuclease/phosphatase family metal-dependent hydrolase